MFLLYFDPAQSKRLAHSTGLQKGLIGRVNVFASHDMASKTTWSSLTNSCTRWVPPTSTILPPISLSIPTVTPIPLISSTVLPQRYAEIMAGRTPISQAEAENAEQALTMRLIGGKTAQEINWR